MAERRIEEEWVKRTLREPDHVRPDEVRQRRSLAFRRIPEHGDRWLRVVFEETAEAILVVTVFFDRGVERWRRR
jgi:hypothetical protein